MYRMITSTPILSQIYVKDTCARLIVKYINIYVDLCTRYKYTTSQYTIMSGLDLTLKLRSGLKSLVLEGEGGFCFESFLCLYVGIYTEFELLMYPETG